MGIAIALSACGSPFDRNAWKRDEIKPSTYRDIANSLTPDEREMVRGFMADGKIDYGELHALNEYEADKADRAVPLASLKAQLAGAQQ